MSQETSRDPCHRVADALRRLSVLLPESSPNGKPILVDTAVLVDLMLAIAEDLDPVSVDAVESSAS